MIGLGIRDRNPLRSYLTMSEIHLELAVMRETYSTQVHKCECQSIAQSQRFLFSFPLQYLQPNNVLRYVKPNMFPRKYSGMLDLLQ